jgi:hypothetical protein
MPDVMMRQIGCKNCMTMSRHPVNVIERIVELQNDAKATHINYACPSCSYVSRQEIPKSDVHRFTDKDWKLFPDDMQVFCVILQCNKSGCGSHVVVLAPLKNNGGLSDLTTAVGGWMADDAVCAQGAKPMQPFAIRIAKSWPFR